MNRIRKVENIFQVLITPSIKISPDSAIMMGNWDDSELRNFYVLEFQTLRDAECEAYKHPDIDWYRIVINHKYIFKRLETDLKRIIDDTGMTVDFYPNLMDSEMFKNTMFDRVANGGDRFSMRYGMSDLLSFTIVNPWSENLHKLSTAIENTREHLYRDDMRIRSRRIVDGKIIVLNGVTEVGSVYEIKLLPTLIYHYGEWYKKTGYLNDKNAEKVFIETKKKQQSMDNNMILR
jgi:hypothetical protein